MNREENLALAVQNIEATYFGVGLAVEGAAEERRLGCRICRSPFGHPMSNFAIATAMTPEAAACLRKETAVCPEFHLYAMPVPHQTGTCRSLRGAGWRDQGTLALLDSGLPRDRDTSRVRYLEDDQERFQACQLAADIFFPRCSASIRATIASATCRSGFALAVPVADEDAATAMAVRTAGTFGIYSVCVHPDHRGRGIGASVVDGLLATAEAEGRLAVLQCEPSMQRWYGRWGFRRSGEIRIFA